MKANPFRPNSPVNPAMFVGRIQEIERLEQALIQTRSGEPAHFMITGERGIGKTSLLLYLKALAKGTIPFNSVTFNFLVLDLDVDSNSTQIGLIRRIMMHLDDQLGQSEPARKFLKETWSLLQRVHIMDSGIAPTLENDLDEVILDEFALKLARICERTCTTDAKSPFSASFDGILLIIDEADNGSTQLNLGSFLKLLTERLQRNECSQVLVGLAGMPDYGRSCILAILLHCASLKMFN